METKVYKELDYLTDVFKAKYGKPSKCYQHPNILKIRYGIVSTFCQWENPDLKIYTGLTEDDSEYYTTGHVISKSMENKFILHKKQKETKGAAKGAESF